MSPIQYSPEAMARKEARAQLDAQRALIKPIKEPTLVPAFVWVVLIVANVAGWTTWALVF